MQCLREMHIQYSYIRSASTHRMPYVDYDTRDYMAYYNNSKKATQPLYSLVVVVVVVV